MNLPNSEQPSVAVYASRDPAGPTVLRVVGEVDYATCASFRDALSEAASAPCRELVIDLSEVGFMDSSGLHALAEATRTISGRGGSISLRNPTSSVHRMLEISGLLSYFQIVGQ